MEIPQPSREPPARDEASFEAMTSAMARLLRVLLAFGGICLLARVLYLWQFGWHEVVVAVAITLLIVGLGLASGFMMAAWLSQPDCRPASRFSYLIGWWTEAIASATAALWLIPFRWSSLPDTACKAGGVVDSKPVLVFVHGFVCNRAIWLPWMRRLRQRGRNYLSVNLEPLFGPLDSYLPAIDTAISTAERCSSAKPIVICHSMGGLVMRAWLAKSAESARRIERVITIGTPHHGTWLGRLSLAANGKQMGIGSRWLEQLKQAEQDLPMQGRPTIENWYSDTDNVVIPASSAVLLGSDDNHRLTAVGHLALIYHPKLLQRLEQL